MPENLAGRVRSLVETSGSVNAAAKAIGLKQPTLQRIVTGVHRNPDVETLSKIAGFYNTTIDWLITGKGEGPRPGIPGRSSAQTEWEEITREVAGGDQDLFKLLTELPRPFRLALDAAVQSFSKKFGNQKWDMQNLSVMLTAFGEAHAAWINLFRAWIDTVGVKEVREMVRLRGHEFAARSFVGTASKGGTARAKKV